MPPPRYGHDLRHQHHSEAQTEEEEEFRRALDSVPPPSPPDGGWGWMVVFASFMINAIVDGVCYSFGIMMPEFIHHFNYNYTSEVSDIRLLELQRHSFRLPVFIEGSRYPTAVMSLAGAVLLGVYMLSGPMASALCNRFGSRRVALGGCVISSLSLFLCQYAEEAPVFILLFSFFTGLGFGLMFLAAIVIVGFYFEKNRSLAATIAMCGSGIGMATLAPLITYLLEEYEWRRGLCLLSGVVLQGVVLAALYRPLDADLRRRKKLILRRLEEDKKIGPQTCLIMQRLLEEKKRQRTVSTGSMNNVIITKENLLLRPDDGPEFRERKPSIINRFKAALGRSKDNMAGGSRGTSAQSSRTCTPQMHHRPIVPDIRVNGVDTPPSTGSPFSVRHTKFSPTPSSLVQDTAGTQGSMRSLQANKSSPIHGASAERQYYSVQDLPAADNISLATSIGAASTTSANTTPEPSDDIVRLYKNHTPDNDRPMYRKDILYSGSVRNLPQYNNNINDYLASITQVPQEESLPEDEHGCCWHRLECFPKSIRDVLRSILDTSTFSSPTYVLLSIASFLTMFGYFVPFLFLPAYAKHVGFENSSIASLLSIMGGANAFGRLLAGALGGRQWMDALAVNNVALVIAGAAVILLPWCHKPYQLMIFSAVFGLCVAAFSSLRSQIVVELMGLDRLTTAFGQLVILHGIAVIVGTPISGLLYDLTGTFNCGFYLSGSVIALSGVICFPLRQISTMEHKRAGLLPPSSTCSRDEVKKAMLPVSLESDVRIECTAESPL